jgi:hypothetical protein
MSPPDDFDQVGRLLGDVLESVASAASATTRRSEDASRDGEDRKAGAGQIPVARALGLVWAEAVGEEVAENATPMKLTNGTLVVSTSSSVWADTLSYMSADLAARLNRRLDEWGLGEGTVRQILFRHAGWDERPRTSGARRPPAGRQAGPKTGPGGRTD